MSVQTGYCPHCEKDVLMRREEFNWFLGIILLIFTSGIGLFVYLVIYLNQDEIYCVHCGHMCTMKQLEYKEQEQLPNYAEQQVYTAPEKLFKGEKAIYCPFCGVELGDRSEVQFCALCGAKVK